MTFEKWGKPIQMKFDNGLPFGDPKRESISVLAQWLIGLGIKVVYNEPRRPQQNAKVERMQSVTRRWSDPPKRKDINDLNEYLKAVCAIQRDKYPTRTINFQTRTQHYPELLMNTRPFDPMDFDIKRVHDFLSKGVWVRKVSSVGQVAIFGENYQLGYSYRNQSVIVKFDKEKPHWHCFTQDNQFIKALVPNNITEYTILNLTICQRTNNTVSP